MSDASVMQSRVAAFAGQKPEFAKVAEGFSFVEGPAWDARAATLYLSDIVESTTYTWREGLGAEVLSRAEVYANGHLVTSDGRLLQAEHRTRRVVQLDRASGEATRVVADAYGSARLNSPNQLLELPGGTMLFTDPGYGLLEPYGGPAEQEQPVYGVYAITDDPSAPRLVIADVPAAHKIALSPDDAELLVNDSSTGLIHAYRLAGDEVVAGSGRPVASLGEDAGLDGMIFTGNGLLLVTADAGILVVDPAEGRTLGMLHVPDVPHNLCWGGADGDELFVTASAHLYRLQCALPGPRR